MSYIRVLGDFNSGYVTHRELDAALALFPAGVDTGWTASDDPAASDLRSVDGLWVAPGSPYRNDAAVLAALRAAREERVPLLATCGGFQYAALELLRAVASATEVKHAEVEPGADDPAVSALACALVGKPTTVRPVRGTRLASLVGEAPFEGFHFCSYGVSPGWLPRLREAGAVESAHGDAVPLEAFELPLHPFYVATAFQPQVGASASHALHPLIAAFVTAARSRG